MYGVRYVWYWYVAVAVYVPKVHRKPELICSALRHYPQRLTTIGFSLGVNLVTEFLANIYATAPETNL